MGGRSKSSTTSAAAPYSNAAQHRSGAGPLMSHPAIWRRWEMMQLVAARHAMQISRQCQGGRLPLRKWTTQQQKTGNTNLCLW